MTKITAVVHRLLGDLSTRNNGEATIIIRTTITNIIITIRTKIRNFSTRTTTKIMGINKAAKIRMRMENKLMDITRKPIRTIKTKMGRSGRQINNIVQQICK